MFFLIYFFLIFRDTWTTQRRRLLDTLYSNTQKHNKENRQLASSAIEFVCIWKQFSTTHT